MSALVTLTTDFGAGSCYVAALKGVLCSIHPEVRLLDLTHRIPPQNLHYTAYFLLASVPFFPPDTLHVVVVDPGVGSERGILYVEIDSQRLLVPDNGCWTALASAPPKRVLQVTDHSYWLPEVTYTFHGRDIFAPVAGHLSRGLAPEKLGPVTEHWVSLDLPQPSITPLTVSGEVVFIDDFGNLLTNIPGMEYLHWRQQPVRVTVAGQEIAQHVRTYAEARAGTAVVLVSSMNTVEIAVCQGNAARQLGAAIGTPVRLERLA